jgi:hypothetical protein
MLRDTTVTQYIGAVVYRGIVHLSWELLMTFWNVIRDVVDIAGNTPAPPLFKVFSGSPLPIKVADARHNLLP